MRGTILLALLCAIAIAKSSHWDEERKLKLDWAADHIKFESSYENDSLEDEIEFKLKSVGSIPMRFKMEYKHEAGKSETEVEARVTFLSVIEYLENSSTFDGFNYSVDKIISRVDFTPSSWLPIQQPQTVAILGGTKYVFNVTYNGSLVVLTVSFGSAPFTAGGWTYSPAQIKIDIAIENYPYARNDTYLALLCEVRSENSIEGHDDDDDHDDRRRHDHDDDSDDDDDDDDDGHDDDKDEGHDFITGGGDVSIAFGWNRTVVADGANCSVVTTQTTAVQSKRHDDDDDDDDDHDHDDFSDDSDDEDDPKDQVTLTYFAFGAVNPKKIDWDPYLGMTGTVTGGASFIRAASLLLVASFLALFA